MKRALDLFLVIFTAPLWIGVVVLTAVVVRLALGSPVLFRQVRPGFKGCPFQLLKFRTMTEARDVNGNYLPSEQRTTSFGHWLRSTSLDEVPELFNVLRGEMSLVGPRPLLTEYLSRYTSEQARRHDVKPGITGWAQVNGRNALSWEEKFTLDVWYVDNQSIWLDLRILWRTVWNVLKRRDVDKPGFVGQEEFLGSRPELRKQNDLQLAPPAHQPQ